MALSHSILQRLFTLAVALLMGHFFLIVQARTVWKNYWILKDGQKGTAFVTKVIWTGHDAVAYRYLVNQEEYSGTDA